MQIGINANSNSAAFRVVFLQSHCPLHLHAGLRRTRFTPKHHALVAIAGDDACAVHSSVTPETAYLQSPVLLRWKIAQTVINTQQPMGTALLRRNAVVGWLLFYVKATSMVISGRVLILKQCTLMVTLWCCPTGRPCRHRHELISHTVLY